MHSLLNTIKDLELLVLLLLSVHLGSFRVVTATHLNQAKCTNRFELRHEIKQRSFTNCEDVIKENPFCGEDFAVAWTEYPPYVFFNEHTERVSGILPSKRINLSYRPTPIICILC